MARMLGRMRPPWCPVCRGAPGPDCPEVGESTRSQKAIERRRFRTEVEQTLAERDQR